MEKDSREYFDWLLDNYPDLFKDCLILLPGHRCQWNEEYFEGPCGLKILGDKTIERVDLPEMHSEVV